MGKKVSRTDIMNGYLAKLCGVTIPQKKRRRSKTPRSRKKTKFTGDVAGPEACDICTKKYGKTGSHWRDDDGKYTKCCDEQDMCKPCYKKHAVCRHPDCPKPQELASNSQTSWWCPRCSKHWHKECIGPEFLKSNVNKNTSCSFL